MQPLVPGFTITGELGSTATGSTWTAVRNLDDHCFVLKIVPADATEAHAQAVSLMAVLHRVENEHVVRLHGVIALVDGQRALVLDQVSGGSLVQVLSARGQLTPGEIVTTVSPLFEALADLHAAGVVLGDLEPANVLFSADGRPLIAGLGVDRLLGRHTVAGEGTSGFLAPELVAGAEPSPASDVYAMAAIGMFCLSGASSAREGAGPSAATLGPETPTRLVEVLTSCLSTDPAARPSATLAAAEIFDAAPPAAVRLASGSDPASEITRRIRAAASSAPTVSAPSDSRRHRRLLVVGVPTLFGALLLGGGMTWFLRHPPAPVSPVAVRPVAHAATSSVASAKASRNMADVMTAPDSPRIAAGELLQALADSRALAYVARNPALLDLVYAPGATGAEMDQGNIAAALRNRGTYHGLAFVVRDAAFVDGTSETARIRATIVTRSYQTGQPDGRKVHHAQDIVGPSVFVLSLTPDGWRIRALTGP